MGGFLMAKELVEPCAFSLSLLSDLSLFLLVLEILSFKCYLPPVRFTFLTPSSFLILEPEVDLSLFESLELDSSLLFLFATYSVIGWWSTFSTLRGFFFELFLSASSESCSLPRVFFFLVFLAFWSIFLISARGFDESPCSTTDPGLSLPLFSDFFWSEIAILFLIYFSISFN